MYVFPQWSFFCTKTLINVSVFKTQVDFGLITIYTELFFIKYFTQPFLLFFLLAPSKKI